MKNHHKLLVVEALTILLPITGLALWGGGYIIFLQLSEKVLTIPLTAILITALTILSLCSLSSLWLILITKVRGKELPSNIKKPVYILAELGALLSVISILSLLLINVFGITEPISNHLSIYIFGTPALIPYLHLVFINRGFLTKCC